MQVPGNTVRLSLETMTNKATQKIFLVFGGNSKSITKCSLVTILPEKSFPATDTDKSPDIPSKRSLRGRRWNPSSGGFRTETWLIITFARKKKLFLLFC